MNTALSSSLAQKLALGPVPKLVQILRPRLASLRAFPSEKIKATGEDPAQSLALLLVLLRIRGQLSQKSWAETRLSDLTELLALFQKKPLRRTLQEPFAEVDALLDPPPPLLFQGDQRTPRLARFYELLLSACNQSLRKERGVYYTPNGLIKHMVTLCDQLCRQEFKASEEVIKSDPNALSPETVSFIDPAAGTGLFLQGIFHAEKEKEKGRGTWTVEKEESLLRRLRGFELLYVPYQVARLDFEALCPGRVLPETLMTWGNSLDGPERHPSLRDAAVFIGNPPYGAFGQQNRSPWIMEQLSAYKDGLGEKKVNLDDDYIKFFRLAHSLLEEKERGLMIFVTNSSFIESPTRRQMRRSLTESFSSLTLIDLGGSRFRPVQRRDENLFDIQCGVAVTAFSRRSQSQPPWRSVCFRGSREEKLESLKRDAQEESWETLKPEAPSYSFQATDAVQGQLWQDYKKFLPLQSLFGLFGSGVKTDRDKLFYDRDPECLAERMKRAFAGKFTEDQKREFRVQSSSSYDLVGRLKSQDFDPENIRPCLYRPFDIRWLYYAPGFTSRPAFRVMQHMNAQNLALLAKRQARDSDYDWVFVSRGLIADGVFAIDNKGRESLFPLFLANGQSNLRVPKELHHSQRVVDFFQYIYALFHSPSYRQIYRRFLRQDYPRVPIAKDPELFFSLVKWGQELISLHCLEDKQAPRHSVDFDSAEIRKGYPNFHEGAIYLEAEKKIDAVPEALWRFRLGGHQVAEKWLKDRRGVLLKERDIRLYLELLGALSRTLEIQEQVDHAIDEHGAWPGAFLSSSGESAHGTL